MLDKATGRPRWEVRRACFGLTNHRPGRFSNGSRPRWKGQLQGDWEPAAATSGVDRGLPLCHSVKVSFWIQANEVSAGARSGGAVSSPRPIQHPMQRCLAPLEKHAPPNPQRRRSLHRSSWRELESQPPAGHVSSLCVMAHPRGLPVGGPLRGRGLTRHAENKTDPKREAKVKFDLALIKKHIDRRRKEPPRAKATN